MSMKKNKAPAFIPKDMYFNLTGQMAAIFMDCLIIILLMRYDSSRQWKRICFAHSIILE